MRLLHQRVFRSHRNTQAFEIERNSLFGQLSSPNVARDLPVVISCASLALADVGIMMYDLVASVSASKATRNLQSVAKDEDTTKSPADATTGRDEDATIGIKVKRATKEEGSKKEELGVYAERATWCKR
ncbi:hypothetical protein Ahy_A02g008164 [Arachis hypogaea]|uniref:Uncharacterized protein n=1 Tax=Arachis hypogaea TaxID=3818 RepID=A0A445EEL8_ARAHY|nr:hypothetical protein Ahy_A02g008164 [Arachis hypogaea]